jgi:hypothetical protein
VAASSAAAAPDPTNAQAASVAQTIGNHGAGLEGVDRGSTRSVAAQPNIRVVSVRVQSDGMSLQTLGRTSNDETSGLCDPSQSKAATLPG